MLLRLETLMREALNLLLVVLATPVLFAGCQRKSANDPSSAEGARGATPDPQVVQQRALAEARATLNVDLTPDDGTFFPATGEIEVGSLLYTLHLLGPAQQRYYTEDAFLAGRDKELFIVRPILEHPRPGASPQSYRSQQARSAETKREEVKAQRKITREELTQKYFARAGK